MKNMKRIISFMLYGLFFCSSVFSNDDTQVSCQVSKTCILPCSFTAHDDVVIHWIQETPPESRVQETPPESRVQETPPESRVQETPPESRVLETPPESRVQETPPESRVLETPPESRVLETPPESRVLETPPESRVQETPPESRVLETPPESRVLETPPESRVHSYYHKQDRLGEQHQRFRGRTSLFEDQISRGNASLLLRGVKVQDQGRYLCNVSTITGNKENFINLNVTAPVQHVNIEQVQDKITCSSEGIYPEPGLVWTTSPPSSRDLQNLQNPPTVQQTEQQLYSISSSLILSDGDTDLDYICTVSTPANSSRRSILLQPAVINGSNTETYISCSTANYPIKYLIWTFNHKEIILNQTGHVVRYITTERWKQYVMTVSETGGLTLKHLTSDQTGTYKCELRDEEETYVKYTFLHIPKDRNRVTVGVVVVLLVLVSGVLGYKYKRMKERTKRRKIEEEKIEEGTSVEVCKKRLKSKLKEKYQCVSEGIAKAGKKTLLEQIYTELYITEGGTGEVNKEHEVRQIEAASRKPDGAETTIRQENIFKPPPGRDEPIRTVMTKGVAGIGKTVLTQKFSLDWAEGRTNQDIQFLLPFTFRQLNVLREEKFSLVKLVHHFFSETRGICNFEEFQVVFIFDGLDESRLPLDFHNNEDLTDVTESTSVDVLLTNLIRGNLLPSARLWITTRPAAANQIPPECVSMVTEVRGFTDPQKEEYFRKRFREEEQTSRIISHIKTSRSLHIMCHIPVFCWITATVLENVLENVLETRGGGGLPKTLTEMYIHFLVVQAKLKKVKYDGGAETDPHWSPESRKMVESLGKLAFEQLQKGNLIFYEPDLRECGIDVREASVYSGVFTQIFREESNLYQDQVFCFIHLSVQEFLAALHVHQTFINSGVNLLEEQNNTETDLYQSAVDKALQSPNGHLDLFLRFLLGLSLETNQNLLRGLMKPKQRSSQNNQETVKYIKKKIDEDLSAERSINLFHCLNELNAGSLVKQVQRYLRSGHLSTDELSPAQWSALVFILLSSGDLEEFDLKKFSASEEALRRLLPVVKASKKVVLSDCNLSEDICPLLSSVLSSQSSSLTELDLSNNHLQDSGLEQLCPGLESPHCHLESLRLSGCNLSGNICPLLSSVLSSQSSSLTELDLSNNDLQDSGLEQLCPGLESPHCHLESLRLSGCLISEEGSSSLVSALTSNPSHLRELDLSYNHPGASAGTLLSRLKDPRWRLDTLRVEPAGQRWLTPGLRKYSFQLTIDTNTVHNKIKLSDNNRKMTRVEEDQSYPDHPDRFDYWDQLLCREVLTGRCYWEVQRRGGVDVSVSYRRISRKGASHDCMFGKNDNSWSLECSADGRYQVWHNNTETSSSSSSSVSDRVAVYLDVPAGTLSFYSVSSGRLILLHTFNTTFTEPLYPGFGFYRGSSVSLC
ncbi:NLR family CARD domain-containing protein 3-like isoform X2 [Cololabis saira]|uniref:NLR family CARD domain-containing protein 3-like isoform X2 n=1 Tax=Cololabis saira TaxID=129043 RepID=UPI002AD46620|nr:NLR family CARD domain-containing protein 3-like isoform X2 [Cololabis saira]